MPWVSVGTGVWQRAYEVQRLIEIELGTNVGEESSMRTC